MNIVYGLVDPRTKLIRYIGKSSTGMKRPRNHMLASKLKRDRSHKANWIRELLLDGHVYDIVVLESVESPTMLDDAERRWIGHGILQGWPLTNLTSGGDGPTEPRPEAVKEKIRQACRKPEAIEKMRAANKGRPWTEQHRANASAAHKGICPDESTRLKMSMARIGKTLTASARAKITASKLGKPRPDLAAWIRSEAGKAHQERLRQMSIGRPREDLANRNKSEAQREAVSKALKGRVFSPETIQRMREGQRRRRERNKQKPDT